MDHIRVYARIKKVRQEVDANVSVDQNHVIIDDEKAVEISDGPIRRSFIFDKVQNNVIVLKYLGLYVSLFAFRHV